MTMKMTSFARRVGVIALALSGTLHSADTIAWADGLRTVALSGQPAPGAPAGEAFLQFWALPVLNDTGQVAFGGNLPHPTDETNRIGGIWSEGSGNLTLVARSGSQAPGTPGLTFSGFNRLGGISNDGKVLFSGSVEPGTNQYNEEGIWSGGSGSLALVARQRNPALGTPNGVYYSDLSTQTLVSNNAAQTVFSADLEYNSLPWGAGLWAGNAGNLRTVALGGDGTHGDHAPGTPSGSVFSTFGGYEGIVLNDAGRAAFLATLWPGSGGVTYRVNDVGIWSEGSGTLALVARAGSQAPGTPAGVTFGPEFFPPAFNNAGQVVFSANLVGSGVNDSNGAGFWLSSSGQLQLVARGGSRAPGTPAGVNFEGLYGGFASLNDAGQIVIRAFLSGSGVNETNDRGIWLGGAESLELVVRTGSHAPGTAAGVNFLGLTEPALNDAGQIAFRASLIGSGVDSTNGLGIWATDATGALQLIVRSGGVLEVGTDDFRTIDDLNMILRHGSSDGRTSGFNDLGQLAFWASFTDGSEGIFLSDLVAVPEPGGAALLCLVVPALLRPRRRGGPPPVEAP